MALVVGQRTSGIQSSSLRTKTRNLEIQDREDQRCENWCTAVHFFSCAALNKSLSYRFLFFLDNKQEMISKLWIPKFTFVKKANKSQNLKNIYVTNTRNSQSIGGTLLQKLKKMLLIGGITIICLVVARSWNYIGDHCVIVNEDVHEKIKKDEQFCLKEYQKDLRTVSWISIYTHDWTKFRIFFFILTPQSQSSLQGTFDVWTDIKVLSTKVDNGEAAM